MKTLIEQARDYSADMIRDDGGEAGYVTMILEMASRIEELETRLEMNHVYREVDGVLTKVPCKPGEFPDGIECRDETIKLLKADRVRILKDSTPRHAIRVGALMRAAEQFRMYEKEHRAKADRAFGQPHASSIIGDEAIAKADVNCDMAKLCEDALK